MIKLLYLVYYISLHNQNQKRKIKNQKFKNQNSKFKNQKFKIQKSKIQNSKKKNCTFQPNGTPYHCIHSNGKLNPIKLSHANEHIRRYVYIDVEYQP